MLLVCMSFLPWFAFEHDYYQCEAVPCVVCMYFRICFSVDREETVVDCRGLFFLFFVCESTGHTGQTVCV